MNWLKKVLRIKAFSITVSRAQKELLEFFIINKPEFDAWVTKQVQPKIRFQFYFPTAIDFYFGEFKLFIAYFKKNTKGHLELVELKMTETNFDSIGCTNWRPFEDVILDFITTLEESQKIALFEKEKSCTSMKTCAPKSSTTETNPQKEYLNTVKSLLSH